MPNVLEIIQNDSEDLKISHVCTRNLVTYNRAFTDGYPSWEHMAIVKLAKSKIQYRMIVLFRKAIRLISGTFRPVLLD